MEGKELWVNMGKTKVLISGPGLDVLQKSGKDPYGMCSNGAGSNSIFCGGSNWIHKKCSGVPGSLKSDPSYRWKQYKGQARPIDGRPMTEVTEGEEKLEVVPSFCYHRDCLSPGSGCQLATITSCRVTWGKFNKLLPVLTSRSFTTTSRGRVYYLSVRSAMLHASETWALTSSDLHRLQDNDRAMIHWTCSVTTKDEVSSPDRLERMQLDDLANVLHTHQLRWHGRVECSYCWLKKSEKLKPTGGCGHGRPKETEVIDMDCLALGLTDTHPSDRKAWSG